MVFQEKGVGEGVYAADENNERNSERGTFVRNGGAVTVGASSSAVVLNTDAVDIRVDGADYSAASGSVTLAANSTAYPRRDLVLAEKGPTASDPASFSVLSGTPIDQDVNDTLVNAGVIEGAQSSSPGYPIHPAADIPEVQPPPAQGLRQQAAVLAMVWVPPGTADSTDLSAGLITDMRMEGIGVSDVLRSGDAVDEIEGYGQTVNATVSNSEAIGGETAVGVFSRVMTIQTPLTTFPSSGGRERTILNLPKAGNSLELWSFGVHSWDGNSYNELAAEFGTLDTSDPSGGLQTVAARTTDIFNGHLQGSPRATVDAPNVVALDCRDPTGDELTAQAYANVIYRGN